MTKVTKVTKVFLKFDSSISAKNKPFFFVSQETVTSNLTFVQSELVKKTLGELGITVIDTTIPTNERTGVRNELRTPRKTEQFNVPLVKFLT